MAITPPAHDQLRLEFLAACTRASSLAYLFHSKSQMPNLNSQIPSSNNHHHHHHHQVPKVEVVNYFPKSILAYSTYRTKLRNPNTTTKLALISARYKYFTQPRKPRKYNTAQHNTTTQSHKKLQVAG